MKRFLPLTLVLAILPGAPAFTRAGEKPAEGSAEKPAEKPIEKSTVKKRKKAATGEGEEKKDQAPGDSKGLTAKQRSNLKKRMRSLTQAGKLEELRVAVQKVLDPKAQADRDLLRDAEFYQAGLLARDGDEKGFWEWAEKAIAHGHINADGFENLSLIPDAIKNSERFKTRMQKLRSEAETVVWQEFVDSVRSGIEKPSAEPLALPAESGIGPHPFSAKDLQGRAACLVVTPILHDGFEKEIAHLKEAAKGHADRVAVAVLFYQYEADEARKKRTEEYLTRSKLDFPSALVTRSYLRPLDIPFYPCHLFLDKEGKLAYRQDGYLPEKKMDFIFDELARAVGPVEKAPEGKKAEPSAPKPEEKAPEPSAPPAAEKPAEKPADKAQEKPAEKPVEKPAEKPPAEKAPPPPSPAPAPPEPEKKDSPSIGEGVAELPRLDPQDGSPNSDQYTVRFSLIAMFPMTAATALPRPTSAFAATW
jgi:hypothetical protein